MAKTKHHELPKGAHAFIDYSVGYDRFVKYSGHFGAFVFEFPNETLVAKFLDEVGGAPHPLGGNRTILWPD